MDLVLTQPGVVGTNFNGARNDMLNISLDHANILDNFITESLGTTQIFTSVDRIEEIHVVTSPADAEYGRGSGPGAVDFQIRHQSVSWQRASITSTTPISTPIAGPTIATASSRSALVQNDAGGSVGGPVRKNKTFFFGLFEANIDHTKSTVTSTTLTQDARQGIFRFYPGVQDANANANNPTVDLSGNPVSPRGATGPLQSVSLFGLDPSRPSADSTGIVAKNLALLPLPNNYPGRRRWIEHRGLRLAARVARRHLFLDAAQAITTSTRGIASASLTRTIRKTIPNGFDGQQLSHFDPRRLHRYRHRWLGPTHFYSAAESRQRSFTAASRRNSPQFHAPWTAAGQSQSSVLPSLSNGVDYLLSLGSEVTSPLEHRGSRRSSGPHAIHLPLRQ